MICEGPSFSVRHRWFATSERLIVHLQRRLVRNQQSPVAVCRTAALLVGLAWLLSMATATGATARLFPASMGVLGGRFYVELASHADVLAMAVLVLLALTVLFSRFRYTTDDCVDGPVSPTEAKQEPTCRYRTWVWVCFMVLIPLGGVLAITAIGEPASQILHGALLAQRRGFTQAALNGVEQEMTSEYSSSNEALYFFASGWAGDLGQVRAATALDVDLIRSSTQIGSIIDLADGLLQYSVETRRSVPASLAQRLAKAVKGYPWQPAVMALLAWDQTAEPRPALQILMADKQKASPSQAIKLRQVIDFIQNHPSPW